MPDPAQQVRSALAHGGTGAAWHALDVALQAAREAGVKAIEASRRLPPDQQLALALQAADEALEGLALELAAHADGTEG
ncbi:MAG TPA: hypothetical protein VFW33_21125 [Gemmataceae bacterium]|nr:hypothetical protein [Gemmataceae bacterium]